MVRGVGVPGAPAARASIGALDAEVDDLDQGAFLGAVGEDAEAVPRDGPEKSALSRAPEMLTPIRMATSCLAFGRL